MQSLIIVSSPGQAISSAQPYSPIDLSIPHPDLLLIQEDKAIGIDHARHIKSFIKLPPFKSNAQVILIINAHTLTLEAQNALLKSLEEPPDYAQFILSTHKPDLILPTIHSRCRIIRHIQTPAQFDPQSAQTIYQQIVSSCVGDRVNLAQQFTKPREKALDFTKDLINYFRLQIRTKPQQSLAENLKLANQTLNELEHNANTNLSLEHLFLNIK